jgi:diguanylate cyclase (GGDEF)-like protein/PAS domain S-box-containing protein
MEECASCPAAEALRHDVASQRFRAAMDATVEAIFLTDRASMRIIDVNRAACELLSMTREQLVGIRPEKLLNVERSRLERAYDALIAGEGPTEPAVIERALPGGATATIEFRRRAYRADEGWLIVTVATDITARIQAERALRDNIRQQGIIASFGHLALQAGTMHDLLDAAVRAAAEGLGAELCAVLRWAPETRQLVLEAGRGWRDDALGTSVKPRDAADAGSAHPAPDAAAPESEAFAFADAAADPDLLDAVHAAHGVRSGIEVLVGSDTAFGVLACYWRRPRAASAADVGFLHSIANALDIAIERRAATQKLARMARYDSLTGLANRDQFRETLVERLDMANGAGRLVGVLYIDLDGFKAVNDSHGHAAGDQLLRAVAERLQASVRSADIVGRLGGDEFGIIVADLACADDAQAVAGKVVSHLGQPFDLDGGRMLITASIGIAVYPLDGADAGTLLRNADSAMYQGKELGRNNFQNYSIAIDAAATERRRLAVDLRHAIARREFELHYQPQVALDSGRVIGVEAMLRWWHPTRGLMLAGEFIRLAEESGDLVRITQWVIDTACDQAAAWRRGGSPDLFVSVNFSPVELRNSDVPHQTGCALQRAGLPARAFEVEVPAWASPAQKSPLAASFAEFARLGVAIAIDDYGGGCASLAALRDFPVAKLKIDAVFTRNIATSTDDRIILKTVVAMARQLGFAVVAKEVETVEQMEALRECGCGYAQGFLFGAPLPADALGELLDASRANLLPDVRALGVA